MKKYIILTIGFFLLAGAEGINFRFAVVGDRTGNTVDNIFEEILDEISLLHPNFVINVGNLIQGDSEDTAVVQEQWDSVLNSIRRLSCKFYFTPGTNDIPNRRMRAVYEKNTGVKRYYSFDYETCHFIILDNSTISWVALPEADSGQFDWLVKDLEKHKRCENIFVFLHVPGYLNALRTNSTCPLLEVFSKYHVRAVFSGNLHSYLYLNHDGTDYIVVGSSGGEMEDNDPARGNFFHYLMVTVKDKDYDIAVIRKGNVFLRNVVTGSDHLSIERAQQEVVGFAGCILDDEGMANVRHCVMWINNTGPDSLNQILKWNSDPTRFEIEPKELAISAAPEERKEYKIKVSVFDPSKIFPLPCYTLAFPFTYGKVCTLKSSLGLTRLKKVIRAKATPVIDGCLDDAVWKSAVPITQLGDYQGGVSAIERTEIYLCHDTDNLYIGARCFESNFSQIRAETESRDGPTYADDNIWFFFDPDQDKKTYYQLIVNSKGVVFDRSCSVSNGQLNTDAAWNGSWEIAAGKGENVWLLEIKIPKASIGPYQERQWGFNFRRLQTRLNDAGYWTLPFGHIPDRFGVLEFE